MNQEIKYSEKSYYILALCFFFCFLGAQQFYLGNKKAGFIRLGCAITLIGLPITIILAIKDCIQLYRGNLYDSKGLPFITPLKQRKEIEAGLRVKMGLGVEMDDKETEEKVNELKEKIKENTDNE